VFPTAEGKGREEKGKGREKKKEDVRGQGDFSGPVAQARVGEEKKKK